MDNKLAPNTTWRCTDSTSEFFGSWCVIVDVDNDPNLNGDGDMEVLYYDGQEAVMKLRRFLARHSFVHKNTKYDRVAMIKENTKSKGENKMSNKTYYLKVTVKEANSGMNVTMGTDVNPGAGVEVLQLIADASKEIDKAITYLGDVEEWESLEHSVIDCITVECRNKRVAKILHEYVNQELLKLIVLDFNN